MSSPIIIPTEGDQRALRQSMASAIEGIALGIDKLDDRIRQLPIDFDPLPRDQLIVFGHRRAQKLYRYLSERCPQEILSKSEEDIRSLLIRAGLMSATMLITVSDWQSQDRRPRNAWSVAEVILAGSIDGIASKV